MSQDELGAHLSVAGGHHLACGRAREIDTRVLQIFTKQPNRWSEPTIDQRAADAFRAAREENEVRIVCSHDSYLLNAATPDPVLLEKSRRGFIGELERSRILGVELICSHPGNATDRDRERGIAQNSAIITEALRQVPSETVFCFETTAGSGTALGCTFEELAHLIEAVDEDVRHRIGVVFDTCHVWAAGYDLVNDYEGVMGKFDELVGFDRLRAFHLNDSQHPLGARKDRHAGIGDGHLGLEPFRSIMQDERLRSVPKFLETPKGDDAAAADRENLARLRSFRA